MNALIHACRRDARALTGASRIVVDPVWLLERCRRRRVFVEELRREVSALGGVPPAAESVVVRAVAGYRRIRAAALANLATDAYATCARVARGTDGLFDDLLRAELLPANAACMVARQHED